MQQMAQGLASLGRGQDSMLVHMTPGEVHGLQSLAQQHGGSLTINPHTGLPEAGFLSSILPMAAAAAAIYFTGGAAAGAEGFMGLSAAQTGMLAGAATGALTNQQNPLMGGLMGGLSGYGMAGMMGGLSSLGTTAPGTAPAAGDFLDSQAATPPPPPPAPTVNPTQVATSVTDQAMAANNLSLAQNMGYVAPPPIATPTPVVPAYQGPNLDALQGTDLPYASPPPQSYGDKLMTGLGKAAASPIEFIKANPGATAAVGLPLGMAAVKAMSAQPTLPIGMASKATPNQFYNAQYSPGTRNPNFGKPGEPYFLNQGYQQGAFSTAYAAAGGSMQDIQANARPILPTPQLLGGATPNENQFYPGANIAQGGASGAPQAPAATDVVGGYDQKLDQYTGEPVRMAEGGTTDIGSIPLGGPMPSGFLSGIQSLVQQNPSMIRQLGGDAQSSPNDYVYDPETQQFVKKSDLPPVQGMK